MTLSADLALDLAALAEAGLELPDLDDLDDAAALVALEDMVLDLAEQLRSIDALYPMAGMLLWVESEEWRESFPAWVRDMDAGDRQLVDQRTQVQVSIVVACALLGGGNRSGKTFGQFMVDVAFALGRDHPMVVAWGRLNLLDLSSIPVGPGQVVIAGSSAAISRRDIRPEIAKLLPRSGVTWYGRDALAEAFVEIVCPGYATPARIWFKSHDQKHDSFKGGKARRYHLDEEPKGREGRLVFEECLRGAAEVGGSVCITATPQDGATWVITELERRQAHGCVTLKIDALANYLAHSPDGIRRWLEDMRSDPDQLRMRRFGDVVDRSGRIYPMFSRGTGERFGPGHVCRPFGIPADWLRFRAADPGASNPSAVLWGAIGDDGTLYVYRCLYVTHRADDGSSEPVSFEDQGRIQQELEGRRLDADRIWRSTPASEAIEAAWCDPAAKGAIVTWATMDLYYDGADNDVDAGISKVLDRMKPASDDRPRLKVFDTCVELIDELEQYRWNPKLRPLNKPLKKDDHACDALRYLCIGVARYFGE